MKKYWFLSLVLVLISCSSQLYVPIQDIASIPLDQLKQGRELYVNRCASCHQLYMPNAYSPTEWVHNLEEMQPKAKITDEEKSLIYNYLVHAPK